MNKIDNMPRPSDEVEREIEKILSYIYDNLGEETMCTWFADYLDKVNDSLSQ